MHANFQREVRVDEVLDWAAAYYQRVLLESELGRSVRARLVRQGIDEPTLRAFGIGYAAGDWRGLVEELERAGGSVAELEAAGIAARSERGGAHAQFRSRVMFPVREPGGRMIGFAGLATNPGPSWPRWLTSPDGGRYRRATALFAIERASAAIAEAGCAVVLSDCLDVLRLHQGGRPEAVAVIRSPITAEHRAQLAAALGVDVAHVRIERRGDEGGGERGFLAVADPTGASAAVEERSAPRVRAHVASRPSSAPLRADPIVVRGPAARAFVQLARVVLGVGIPLAWLAIMRPGADAPEGAGTALGGVAGAIAATYVVLTLLGSRISAGIRARSRARRMRTPWERGATEWQPVAWTYHAFEDILIGAAIISACAVLVLTILDYGG